MNKINLILLSFNLLLLGIMVGVGVMVAPRLMHGHCGVGHGLGGPPDGRQGMIPPHQLLERQLGPDFHQSLAGKLETAEPGWGDKLKAARARLQQAIVAEPFDPEAFKTASVEFDRLMDEFHATMRMEMHNRIMNAPIGERQGLGKALAQMPLPLVDEPQGGPQMNHGSDHSPDLGLPSE